MRGVTITAAKVTDYTILHTTIGYKSL